MYSKKNKTNPKVLDDADAYFCHKTNSLCPHFQQVFSLPYKLELQNWKTPNSNCIINTFKPHLTWGPPMMKRPEGWIWKTVLSSKYWAGMTGRTTCSMRSLRSWSRVTVSSCWAEITTVCTRRGLIAPQSEQYSTVTCDQNDISH